MVNRNLLRDLYDVEDLDHEVATAMADAPESSVTVANVDLNENAIVEGRIIRVDDEFVLVDVGYKSEGQIPRNEWDEDEDPPEIGQVLKVLIEEVEDSTDWKPAGMIALTQAQGRKSKTGTR